MHVQLSSEARSLISFNEPSSLQNLIYVSSQPSGKIVPMGRLVLVLAARISHVLTYLFFLQQYHRHIFEKFIGPDKET